MTTLCINLYKPWGGPWWRHCGHAAKLLWHPAPPPTTCSSSNEPIHSVQYTAAYQHPTHTQHNTSERNIDSSLNTELVKASHTFGLASPFSWQNEHCLPSMKDWEFTFCRSVVNEKKINKSYKQEDSMSHKDKNNAFTLRFRLRVFWILLFEPLCITVFIAGRNYGLREHTAIKQKGKKWTLTPQTWNACSILK